MSMRIIPAVPGPGQESVWDYPRPPRIEPSTEHIRIVLGGELIADTTDSLRVLETSHPPVYYLPRSAFVPGALEPAAGSSFCEFKGSAEYLTVRGGGEEADGAAWSYPEPSSGFEALAGWVAVYAGRMDYCEVEGERVQPQPGRFYGGWITQRILGPFKGEPGTMGW
ncbi:DUF427 domain-containing protein [Pseudarthrobacter sp. efr-133-R2A-89]|uniref:DUF427 domain-containing protein n=1 Tax=Pseudarthrobacter sp. efr-133-R2A-89 TaxID=3040302 RepID=UPI00255411DB|nr:DUF427 domain-containing protein [Pseudarthrobacter sp. efr-133-R2A-89]